MATYQVYHAAGAWALLAGYDDRQAAARWQESVAQQHDRAAVRSTSPARALYQPTRDGPDRFFGVVEKSRSPRLPKGRVLDGYRANRAQGLYPVHLAALAAGKSTGEQVGLRG
jgi:hypothetical protein